MGGSAGTGSSITLGAAFLTLLLVIVGLALPEDSSASPGWEIILDRPTPDFRDIEFVSDAEGWLLSGSGLLHSTDGGATWAEAADVSALAIDFADADYGWAVGYEGAIYGTSDGGASWEIQDSGTSVHLLDVAAVSANEAWAVGSGEGFSDVVTFPIPSAFLHTTDGGETWVQVDTPEDSWFREIKFVGDTGWALGQCREGGPPGCGPEPPIGGPSSLLLRRTSDGGDGWVPAASTVPPGARALSPVSADEAWVLAYLSADFVPSIFHTLDGGESWEQQYDGSAFAEMEDLSFQDALSGWALAQRCYEDGCPRTLIGTADGGASWEEGDIGPAEGAGGRVLGTEPALYVITQGGVSEGGVALRSTDGGSEWQHMEHPALSLLTLDFVDRETGYARSSGGIARTDDAGRTWRRLPNAPTGVSALAFSSETTGVAVRTGCCDPPTLEVYLTEDGGTSWASVHETGPLLGAFVHDIEFADSAHGWIASESLFLFTEDGGRSWREEAPDPPAYYLLDADLADDSTAWAILPPRTFGGTINRLIRTNDAGRTWEVLLEAPEGAERIEFVDREHGWYVTRDCTARCHDTLHATADGGSTWRRIELEDTRIADIVFVDPLNGWMNASHCDALGCVDDVQHTADGGLSWTAQLAGTNLSGALEFADTRTGWFNVFPRSLFGLGAPEPRRTVLYHTTDAGGGPVGLEPTTTIALPPTGAGPSGESGADYLLPALTALGLAGALLGALRRRR